MKKFLLKLCAYVLLLFLALIGINALYIFRINQDNFGSMGRKKHDNCFIKDVPDNIQLCNFGSSHGYYDFNYDGARKKFMCFNFALPSQTLLYDYKILRNYMGKISKGAKVFIVVSHFSFFGVPDVKEGNFASKNKRYYRFLDTSLIEQYDRVTDFYVNCAPALATDNVIEFLKKLFVPEPDMWNDVTNHEDALIHGAIRYKGFIVSRRGKNGTRIYKHEAVQAMYDIINLCREIGAEPIMITTPYLKEYNDEVMRNDPEFYGDFYSVINKIIHDTGIKYYDYSSDARFTNDYGLFFNTDHMNRQGARLFTDTLLLEALSIDVNAK